jgi:hypothetical protein
VGDFALDDCITADEAMEKVLGRGGTNSAADIAPTHIVQILETALSLTPIVPLTAHENKFSFHVFSFATGLEARVLPERWSRYNLANDCIS